MYSPFGHWDIDALKMDHVPAEPLNCVDGDRMMDRCRLTRRRKRWARWGCAGWKLGPANHWRVPFKPLGAKKDNKEQA